MYPPAPMLAPHESSEECVVGGFRILRSTVRSVNMWAIQNDPKLWPSPIQFRPERFDSPVGARDGFKLMLFGLSWRRAGPESEGIGIEFALSVFRVPPN
ncbi:hypothetical protein OIU84_015600 [Salix udensis]|uniref:Uncharacterized protein n=1 Tax=Salix udensis TaxID=889485 RepID=A0AAD6J8G0_9ROSI|nr:hypothetical protein OIU84_015600 [Salix udensis]